MKVLVAVVAVLIIAGAGYYFLGDREVPVANEPAPMASAPETPAAARPDDMPKAATEAKPVTGTADHPASGTARIVEADGKTYVRYENFETIDGPDLFIYLAKDLEAKEFVDLGRITALKGNINYAVPENVDPRDYPYVMTWCKKFGVLFNSAKLY